MTFFAGFVLTLIVAGLGWLVLCEPFFRIAFAVLFAIGSIMVARDMRRIKRLAASRQGESICTFARSFDRRTTDTWILRAVYEELQTNCGASLPIRADDDFEHDFGFDGEDLHEVGEDVAFRAGRSLENCEQNPMYGKVRTVRDLVAFLSHQPRVKGAA